MDRRNILKEFQRFLDGHIQHIIDAFAFVFDFKSLTIVPLTATYFTRYIHIREKVHLNFKNSVSAACLTSSTLDIKTESSLLVSARLGIRCSSKQISDHVKHTGIRCRIWARCTSDRWLIDINDLVQLLKAQNIVMISGDTSRTVQSLCKVLVQYLICQWTLSRSGYSGNTGHDAQWNIHINIL